MSRRLQSERRDTASRPRGSSCRPGPQVGGPLRLRRAGFDSAASVRTIAERARRQVASRWPCPRREVPYSSAVADHWPIFGRDAPDVAWRPDPESAREARLARFLQATGERSLDQLQRRATADPGWFWGAAADDIGIEWGRRPREVVDLSPGPAWARWWIGGAFDYTRAATESRAARDPEGGALAWEGEDGSIRTMTNAELQAAVDLAARRLHAQGVRTGDRVGILLPMLIETVVAVLAVGRLGAIY